MRHIRDLIDQYPYIAMVHILFTLMFPTSPAGLTHTSFKSLQDTEFPGVVARPIGSFKTSSDYHYQTMRCNVDLLKIIQLGITLADEEGQFPQECSTWQFNFRFSLACVIQQLLFFSCSRSKSFVSEDMYPQDSVEQLQKAGIEFQKHEEYGILPNDFAELMITSGLVLAPETKWISFHRWVRLFILW